MFKRYPKAEVRVARQRKSTNVFDYVCLDRLSEGVRKLFNQVACKTPVPLSMEGFAEMFIPAEYRQVYLNINEFVYIDTYYQSNRLTTKLIDEAVTFEWPKRYPKPLFHHLQLDVNTYDVNDLMGYIHQRKELIKQFSMLKFIMTHLNKKCNSPAEMKYYLPGLQVLADFAWDKSSPKPKASLHPVLRELCRQGSALIATAQIVGDGVPQSEDEQLVKVIIPKFDFEFEHQGTTINITSVFN